MKRSVCIFLLLALLLLSGCGKPIAEVPESVYDETVHFAVKAVEDQINGLHVLDKDDEEKWIGVHDGYDGSSDLVCCGDMRSGYFSAATDAVKAKHLYTQRSDRGGYVHTFEVYEDLLDREMPTRIRVFADYYVKLGGERESYYERGRDYLLYLTRIVYPFTVEDCFVFSNINMIFPLDESGEIDFSRAAFCDGDLRQRMPTPPENASEEYLSANAWRYELAEAYDKGEFLEKTLELVNSNETRVVLPYRFTDTYDQETALKNAECVLEIQVGGSKHLLDKEINGSHGYEEALKRYHTLAALPVECTVLSVLKGEAPSQEIKVLVPDEFKEGHYIVAVNIMEKVAIPSTKNSIYDVAQKDIIVERIDKIK